MGKIKTFIYSFYRSTTSLDYYTDIVQTRFIFSLKYFIFFSFLYACLNAVWLYTSYLQPVRPIINDLPSHISTIYPQELVITISNGQVTTNVNEPYIIPFIRLTQVVRSINDQVLGASTEPITNLLVIDTQAFVEDISRYNTFALLTADSFVYINPRATGLAPGQIEARVVSLEGITGVISRPIIEAMLRGLQPYFNALLPITFVLLVIISITYLPYLHLMYLLAMAVIILFIARLIDVGIQYAQSLQIAIHLFSVITLIFYGLRLIGLHPDLPLLRSTVITLSSMLVLLRIRQHKRFKRRALKIS